MHLDLAPTPSFDYGDAAAELPDALLYLLLVEFPQEYVRLSVLLHVSDPRLNILWLALPAYECRGGGINLDLVTLAHVVHRVALLDDMTLFS